MNRHYPDPLGAFLQRLARTPATEIHDAMFNECIEAGGCWLRPESTARRPATHQVEIHLHGILGAGPSDDEAIASWMRAAAAHWRATAGQGAA